MRVLIFILAIAFIAVSCRNPQAETENEETGNETALVFGDPDYSLPQLSASAREQAINWAALEDILTVTKKLNGSDFQSLKNYSEQLTEYSNQFTKEMPQTIKTNQVRSRLLVLKTRAELLNQVTHRGTVDSADLQNSVAEINRAVSNLVLHLNEKFQKDKIDLQRMDDGKKELKGQTSFRDSIFELERQDQNRKM